MPRETDEGPLLSGGWDTEKMIKCSRSNIRRHIVNYGVRLCNISYIVIVSPESWMSAALHVCLSLEALLRTPVLKTTLSNIMLLPERTKS